MAGKFSRKGLENLHVEDEENNQDLRPPGRLARPTRGAQAMGALARRARRRAGLAKPLGRVVVLAPGAAVHVVEHAELDALVVVVRLLLAHRRGAGVGVGVRAVQRDVEDAVHGLVVVGHDRRGVEAVGRRHDEVGPEVEADRERDVAAVEVLGLPVHLGAVLADEVLVDAPDLHLHLLSPAAGGVEEHAELVLHRTVHAEARVDDVDAVQEQQAVGVERGLLLGAVVLALGAVGVLVVTPGSTDLEAAAGQGHRHGDGHQGQGEARHGDLLWVVNSHPFSGAEQARRKSQPPHALLRGKGRHSGVGSCLDFSQLTD